MKVLFDNSIPGLNLMEVLFKICTKSGDAKDVRTFSIQCIYTKKRKV